MAVNETRSMNANLEAGLTDGTLKKIAPDRGGDDTDAYSAQVRNGVLQEQYGARSYDFHQDDVAGRLVKLSEKPIPSEDWSLPVEPAATPPIFP